MKKPSIKAIKLINNFDDACHAMQFALERGKPISKKYAGSKYSKTRKKLENYIQKIESEKVRSNTIAKMIRGQSIKLALDEDHVLNQADQINSKGVWTHISYTSKKRRKK